MNENRLKKISWSLLSICLVVISYFILKDANWILGDDNQFLTTTAIGRASHACYGVCRFWPLGLCDYTLLLIIPYGNTITAHLIYNIVIMYIAVGVLFKFLNRISNNDYLVSLFFMLVMFSIPSFIKIHMNCIFSERMMFLTLVLFMFFYWNAIKLQSNRYYALAFFFIVYSTYLKEPVFGAVIIIAFTNFMFGNLTKKDKIFNYALLANAFIYFSIFIYRFFSYLKKGGGIYHEEALFHISRFEIIKNIFSTEPILILIMLFSFIRAYNIIFNKDRQHLFFDGLIFAASGYICAYIILAFSDSYYFFPAIILSLPSLTYWAKIFSEKSRILFSAIIISSCLFVIPSVAVSVDEVQNNFYHRRNDMKLINWIVNEYKQGTEIIWLEKANGKDLIKSSWLLRVYRGFTNYLLGIRDKLACIFKLKSDLNGIPLNCIVLCPDNAEYRDFLIANDFKLIAIACNVEIYSR